MAGVPWREAELFGMYGYFDNQENRSNVASFRQLPECKDDEGTVDLRNFDHLAKGGTGPLRGASFASDRCVRQFCVVSKRVDDIGVKIMPPELHVGSPNNPQSNR